MIRTNSLLVAAMLAAILSPPDCPAQLAKNTNQSRKLRSVIGGGSGNLIVSNTQTAVIGGGEQNIATGDAATVGGGYFNNNSGSYYATIGGGGLNTNTGYAATIGGGNFNEVSAYYATVGGGRENAAGGNYATVPGGTRCNATNIGSFVWSGDSGEATGSFGNGTFTVRCEGGARFYTADGTNQGPRLAANGTDWIANSDSNLKTKVTAINPREILEKLSRLPVTEWEYKAVPDRRYIGPMAQDFHAVFGLGEDDKGIGTLDSDGVMYAAIQGLVEELKERDSAMAERDAKISKLESELGAVREQLSKLPPAP